MKLFATFLALVVAIFLTGRAASQESILNSPHNLSVSGPGSTRALTESEVCVFCHTPHNSSPAAPLWNRADSGSTYTTYTSTTMKVAPGQPSRSSRLCLSCHDGTVALGEVLSRQAEIAMSGSSTMPPGRSRIGVDLSDDHPVSFSYAAAAGASTELRPNPTDGTHSMLDSAGDVQCTSCHDPHDNAQGNFLRVAPQDGALCGICHEPTGWALSSHSTSTATWNGQGLDPWPRTTFTTVKENACDNCHNVHRAGGRFRLLNTDVEEDVCFTCHNGNVAAKNVLAEFNKLRTHNVAANKGDHDPTETPDGRATHVECADCHNPHRVNTTAVAGLPGSLRGVKGLDATGNPVAEATKEYELCFKCHSDDADQNPRRILRDSNQPNIRRLFDPANPSYHPLLAVGKNPDVPSLLPGWTIGSIVKCTDCHNNDTGPGAGGTGPKGPHGSQWEFLLERRYETATPTTESATVYAICYKCHSRTSIRNDDSFRYHDKHLRENVSCSGCHAPHGIDLTQQGSGGDHTHLINFDLNVVSPNRHGKLEFLDQGRFKGTCSLLCHGEDHRDEGYG